MSDVSNSVILQQVIINILGHSSVLDLNFIFKTISEHDGNIINSKLSNFKDYYSGTLTVEGRWDSILRIEESLNNLVKNVDFHIIMQRIPQETNDTADSLHQNDPEKTFIPYKLSVHNIDEPGLIEKISTFFELQEITIIDLNSACYTSEYDTEMVQLDIKIKVPGDLHLPSLREQFDILCYNENLDACLSPIKK